MDALDGLEPGRYMVGREDGSVDPFFVRVYPPYGGNAKMTPTKGMTHLLAHAIANPGWWWRRVDPPDSLPSNIEDIPRLER